MCKESEENAKRLSNFQSQKQEVDDMLKRKVFFAVIDKSNSKTYNISS